MPPRLPIARALRLALLFGVFFTLFLWLGHWQWQRMHEKEALFERFESGGLITLPLSRLEPAEAERYQRVIVSGRYDGEHQILLDNMTHQGRVGYRVLTPLQVAGPLHDPGTVLVDRGWVPADPRRVALPQIAVADDLRGLSGRLDHLPRAGIELPARMGPGWPKIVSYPTLAELEAALEQPLFPYIILLDADQPEGFVREWRPATFPPQRHLGYAVTWFALAAAVAVAYVVVLARGGVH